MLNQLHLRLNTTDKSLFLILHELSMTRHDRQVIHFTLLPFFLILPRGFLVTLNFLPLLLVI